MEVVPRHTLHNRKKNVFLFQRPKEAFDHTVVPIVSSAAACCRGTRIASAKIDSRYLHTAHLDSSGTRVQLDVL
jgi:hypothetical protein